MSWLLQQRPGPDAAMKILGIVNTDKESFGRAYIATELTVRAWVASIRGNAEKAGNLIWLAYQANPQDHWIADALADNMLQSISQASQHGLSRREALQKILKVSPNFVGAIRALWHLEQSAGNKDLAERYRLRLLAVSPLDSEARVTH
jgi:spermidine synthase